MADSNSKLGDQSCQETLNFKVRRIFPATNLYIVRLKGISHSTIHKHKVPLYVDQQSNERPKKLLNTQFKTILTGIKIFPVPPASEIQSNLLFSPVVHIALPL